MPRLHYTGPTHEDVGTSALPLPEGWPAEDVDVSDELAKEMLASGLYERMDRRKRETAEAEVVEPLGAEANLEASAPDESGDDKPGTE